MITGRNIVYISSIEWDFLWQGHQEIALRLAAAGNRVLYIENTGIRSPGIRDRKRIVSRIKHWKNARRSKGACEVAPNLFISSPLVLPPFGARLRRILNRRLFLRSIAKIAAELEMNDPVIWTYLPTDTVVDLIHLIRREKSVVVYYGVADFSYLTPQADRLEESERELLRMSDVVFANCSELAQRFSRLGRSAHVFAPGVNLTVFSENGVLPFPKRQENSHPTEEAPSTRSIPAPRIGYVGGLHRFVDYNLVCHLAEARPDWSWIFVGARQVELRQLERLPNVYLLGQKPHEELPKYLKLFDVCLVPYLTDDQMSTVTPTKINEYLAVGKPIISTNLPTVCEFNAEYNVLITSSSEPKLFLEAIEKAVATPGDEATIRRRKEVAALADWNLRLELMTALIQTNGKP